MAWLISFHIINCNGMVSYTIYIDTQDEYSKKFIFLFERIIDTYNLKVA